MTEKRLQSRDLYEVLSRSGVTFFCGVPDSLLSPFCQYLEDTVDKAHFVTANEGNAIGVAAGYYAATGRVPFVYMQNSGFGNTIDPLGSLTDPLALSIPMLLMISWRGQPDTHDEPQHRKQGSATLRLLETMGVPYEILSEKVELMSTQVGDMVALAKKERRPCALIVQKGLFAEHTPTREDVDTHQMSREQAVRIIAETIGPEDRIVSGVGKVSRELFEYRAQCEKGHEKDLLVVGSMGHASSVALGVALNTERRIFCLDGDGAVLMHLGSMTTIGVKAPQNFYHIVINNGSHDSVGGQRTAAFKISIPAIATACGYLEVFSVHTEADLRRVLDEMCGKTGPICIEVVVRRGARADLGRPTIAPSENVQSFLAHM